jgi:hypothetical protein
MALVVPHRGVKHVAPRPNRTQRVSKELFSVRASVRDGVNHPLTAIHFDKGERETHAETT